MIFVQPVWGIHRQAGRIGSILAPTLIALILATGISPNSAFAMFAVPSIIAAVGYILVREKYASFDRLANADKRLESNKVITV